jgi:hypothetical protein
VTIDDNEDDGRTKTSYPGPRFAPGPGRKKAARKKAKKRKAARPAKRRAKKKR